MQEKLYSMKKELAELLGRDRLLKSAVKEVNKLDMIKASMVIRNPHHETIDIDRILGGELKKDLALGDYVFIENFCKLVKLADNCLDMGNYIDKNFLISAYRTLADDSDGYFRKSNPVVYTFNHVPVHSLDIEEKLDDAMRRVYRPEAGNNVVLKAMYIHNKLIDIYPFPEFNGEIAVFTLNYYLMENGFTPINMPVKREQYCSMVADCLKGQNQEVFYNFLMQAVYDKMEGTVDACIEYLKNNQPAE